MTARWLITRCSLRRWAFAVCAAALCTLVGCKSSKESSGLGVGRGKDPLVAGPNLIPRQNVPLPERGIGTKGKPDPLTSPVGGRNDKVGYNDDPDRFKGTVIPDRGTTPAALTGRYTDGDELKLELPGVTLQPGGAVSLGRLDASEGVEPLLAQLDKFGVKREDRTLERQDGRYVFRASVPLNAEGAKRQYVGEAATAQAAVKQVVDQIASDK